METLPDGVLKSVLVLCGRQAPALAIVCARWRDALRCPSTLHRLCAAQWQQLCGVQWTGVARHAGAGDATALTVLFRDLALARHARWRSELRHRGTSFPRYEHGAALLYDGAPVALTAEQEEAATAYAADRAARRVGFSASRDIGVLGPQKKDDDALFRRNFFVSWRPLLDRTDAGRTATEFARCDFSRIEAHLESTAAGRRERQREAPRHVSDATSSTDDCAVAMGQALVDGRLIRIVNFEMPPAGLLRGVHARGRFRPRYSPEDATLNLDAAAPVPRVPDVGDGVAHSWGGVVSNPTVTWVAHWRNSITGGHEHAYTFRQIFRNEEERRRAAEEDELAELADFDRGQAEYDAERAAEEARLRAAFDVV